MGQHLKWSKKEKARQVALAHDYLGQFGTAAAAESGAWLQWATAPDWPGPGPSEGPGCTSTHGAQPRPLSVSSHRGRCAVYLRALSS